MRQQYGELWVRLFEPPVIKQLANRHTDRVTAAAGLGFNEQVLRWQNNVTEERPGQARHTIKTRDGRDADCGQGANVA